MCVCACVRFSVCVGACVRFVYVCMYLCEVCVCVYVLA